MRLAFILVLFFSTYYNSNCQINLCGMPSNEPPGCLLDTSWHRGVTNNFSTSTFVQAITGASCGNIVRDGWMQIIPLCDQIRIKARQVDCFPRIPSAGVGVAVLDKNFQVIDRCYKFLMSSFRNQEFIVNGLEPGETYHFMTFAVQNNVNCVFQLTFEGLSTFGLNNGPLRGKFEVGTGSELNYSVLNQDNVVQYDWQIPAGIQLISGQGTNEIMVRTPTIGQYILCCEITYQDGSIVNNCDTIDVTDTYPIYAYEHGLYCKGSCYDYRGDCLNAGGTYFDVASDGNGRDSIFVLELCLNTEPQVGIYGAPSVEFAHNELPAGIFGFTTPRIANYQYEWLTGAGNPIPNSNNTRLLVNDPGNYCFVAINLDTGCSDTTCINVDIAPPLPPPCGVASDEPPGCTICGPSYSGNTEGYTPGTSIPGFCGTIENNQWLSFVAAAPNASITIRTFNCLRDLGVQLYMADQNLNPVSTCFSSGGNNTPGQITATNLTPGDIYYIMIDGFAGDICDFTINVFGGVFIGPPDAPAEIAADNIDAPCSGQTICYSTNTINGATEYIWAVYGDGTILSGQGTNSVCVRWTDVGMSQLCLTPSNPCFDGDSLCIDIVVTENKEVYLDTMFFCDSDFPLDVSQYCQTSICPGTIDSVGEYCVTLSTVGGCDSVVCYTFGSYPNPSFMLDTAICKGGCVIWYNDLICSPGTSVVQGTDYDANGCRIDYVLNVIELDPQAIIAPTSGINCEPGSSLLLDGSNSTFGPDVTYEWTASNGGVIVSGMNDNVVTIGNPGTYTLEVTQTFKEVVCKNSTSIDIVGTLDPLVLDCQTTNNQILFTWNDIVGVIDYTVLIGGVIIGNQQDTFFLETGLMPNDVVMIEVFANADPACGGTQVAGITCQAQNCPIDTVRIVPVDSICRDSNSTTIQLDYTFTSATPADVLTWGGPGVDTNGIFNPLNANLGNNLISLSYRIGTCVYTATTTIFVQVKPRAQFEIETPVCVTDTSEIIFSGSASSNADYYWNFDNGNSLSGSNSLGPHEIIWSDPGSKNISLYVIESNCPSDTTIHIIDVEAPLDLPIISCISQTNSILFSWLDVPNATDYQVNVISGQTGDTLGNSISFINLAPLESVTIEVIAEGNSVCGPSRDTITCMTRACPTVDISFQPIPEICLYPNASNLNLSDYFNVQGASSNATITWSGGSYINSAGQFTPIFAGAGTHVAIVTILDDNCEYVDSTNVIIHELPTAIFSVERHICVTDSADVIYTGSAPSNATYYWNFGNGIDQLGGIAEGPFALQWNESGLDTVSLFVEANQCLSDTVSIPVRIDPTLEVFPINCSATIDGIIFDWSIPYSITDYSISFANIPSQATTNQSSDTSMVVSNLAPNDEVTIILTVIDTFNACPAITLSQTCEALNCPIIDFSIAEITPICLEQGVDNINLTDSIEINGSNTNGQLSLSGIGVDVNGIFSPTVAGVGTHIIQLLYEWQGCTYDSTFTVTVNPLPIANAGMDQIISCFDTITTIGSPLNANNPSNTIYSWTGQVSDNTSYLTQTSVAGNYILQAFNPLTQCTNSDTTNVTYGGLPPTLYASVENISCFGSNDGVINIDSVIGGTSPFLYALNEGAFGPNLQFTDLGPGVYEVFVQDAIGCQHSIQFIIEEPDELTVELTVILNEHPIPLGDSVELRAITNYAPELLQSIQWFPSEEFPFCNGDNIENCLSYTVTPAGQTVYRVVVENLNGCLAEDSLPLETYIKQAVYIPSGFSPHNNDGINDVFRIYADPQFIVRVKTFRIFDRWGALLFEKNDFLPLDNSHGWNGIFRGKKLQPGVFAYFADIEFYGGATQIYKGDVTLK